MNLSYAKHIMQKTKNDYNEIAYEFSATRKTIWEEFADLNDYVREDDRVLDIGCGNGRLFGYLSGRIKNFSYAGLDISEKLIEIAQKNYLDALPQNKEFKVFDGINISYPENSFDVVFCLATLPHLPGEKLRLKFLENIRKSAKPGALLVITCWNLWQFKFILFQLKMTANFIIDKIFGKGQYDLADFYIPWKKQGVAPIYRYYHAFTQKELGSLLKKSGWEALKLGYKKRHGTKNFNLFAVARKV